MSPTTSTPELAGASGAKGGDAQVFDNPSDREAIVGFVAGALAFFLGLVGFALRVLDPGSMFAMVVLGGAFLLALPAIFHSLIWRIAATLGGLGLAISYTLETVRRFDFLQNAHIPGTPQVTGVEVASSAGAAALWVLFAGLVSWWDLKEAKATRNFAPLINGVVSIALAILAWSFVNFTANQKNHTFDWTADQLYTLSSESKKHVAGIQKPLVMHIFWNQDAGNYSMVKRLADQYEDATAGRITVKAHDPFRDEMTYRSELERLEVSAATEIDRTCVVFELGRNQTAPDSGETVWVKERTIQIGVAEMFADRSVGARHEAVFKGEQLFTNAILELQGTDKPVVYFLTGHGEHGLSERGATRGLGKLAAHLQRRYMEIKPLELRSRSALPEDCDVLVIAGATEPLTDNERTLLESWLADGGRLFLLLDYLPGGGDSVAPSPVAGLAALAGVDATNNLVFGIKVFETPTGPQPLPSPQSLYFHAFDPQHPITAPFIESSIYGNFARALRPARDARGYTVSTLVHASKDTRNIAIQRPRTFQRTNRMDPRVDLVEDFGIAVAAERRPKAKEGDGAEGEPDKRASRVVVCGDVDVIANPGVDRVKNLAFFLNSLSWLLDREDQVIIEAKKPPSYALEGLSTAPRLLLQFSALFVLPLFPLALGVLMFLLRRR